MDGRGCNFFLAVVTLFNDVAEGKERERVAGRWGGFDDLDGLRNWEKVRIFAAENYNNSV